MSKINVLAKPSVSANTVSDFLKAITEWHEKHNIEPERKSLSGIWYRGMSAVQDHPLQPGVYRENFSNRSTTMYGDNADEKRINLEREMINEFRHTGSHYLKGFDLTEQYFVVQHFGMPTCLLDWTTNPLAGLFFAVRNEDKHKVDGEVFVMQATGIYEKGKKPNHIMSMRHPHVVDAVEEIMAWRAHKQQSLILAVRPDNQPGRIGQQSSCFTLHMHKSKDCSNPTLDRIAIPKDKKRPLLMELRRMNINEFTIYNDLDHLSDHIKRAWGA